jgi:hypothetical protein
VRLSQLLRPIFRKGLGFRAGDEIQFYHSPGLLLLSSSYSNTLVEIGINLASSTGVDVIDSVKRDIGRKKEARGGLAREGEAIERKERPLRGRRGHGEI